MLGTECTDCGNFALLADRLRDHGDNSSYLKARAGFKKEASVASMRTLRAIFTVLILSAMVTGISWAQTAPMTTEQPTATQLTAAVAQPKIDSGDTAWLLMSSALVLLMTAPGLALFYGGMVRQKNALATLMQSFIIMAIISLQWVLWGYSLAFGPDHGGIIGGLDWIGLRGVGGEPHEAYAKTIPHRPIQSRPPMMPP